MKNLKFIILFTLAFGLLSQLNAQRKKSGLLVPNLRNFDEKKIHFGFTLGFNHSTLRMNEKIGYPNSFGDSIIGITPKGQPGFNLALVAAWHITPQIILRFVPELAFEDRALIFSYSDQQTFEKRIESTFIHFPLLLKLRTKRIHNFAPYIIGGAMYSIDASSNQKKDNIGKGPEETVVKIKQNQFNATGGMGFDFFLPYFKFGIELKMNFGLGNSFINDGTRYSEPIDWLKTRSFTISFTFEG